MCGVKKLEPGDQDPGFKGLAKKVGYRVKNLGRAFFGHSVEASDTGRGFKTKG